MSDTEEARARRERIVDRANALLNHANMHGWRVTGWRVGVTALDGMSYGQNTEDITAFMGWPVTRDCAISRDAILIDTEPTA